MSLWLVRLAAALLFVVACVLASRGFAWLDQALRLSGG